MRGRGRNFGGAPLQKHKLWLYYAGQMRVSGTLLDRLLIRFLPVAILPGAILYGTISFGFLEFLKIWLAILLILWVFDSILLLTKGIKRLSIVDEKLKVGSDIISTDSLLAISKVRDERRGTVIRTIQLEYLKDGMLRKVQIITKPTLGDIFGRKTKTIDILISKFPDLTTKVFGEV